MSLIQSGQGLVDLVTRKATEVTRNWWRDFGVSLTKAKVDSVSPLRIIPSGQQAAVAATPDNFFGPLDVGDTVLAARSGSWWIVLGRIGGASATTLALSSLFVAGNPLYAPEAHRDAAGYVVIDGGISRAANAGLGTPEIPTGTYVTVATLPAKWRPVKYQYYPTALPNNPYVSGLRIQVSGAIEVIFGADASTAVVLPLTGIRFKAA